MDMGMDSTESKQPEWAFANILDQIYDHQAFIQDYLQPLTSKAGYNISVKVSTSACSTLSLPLFIYVPYHLPRAILYHLNND